MRLIHQLCKIISDTLNLNNIDILHGTRISVLNQCDLPFRK